MGQDLATAGTSELVEWAAALGLSTRGNRRDIEDRILDYYGIDRSEIAETVDGSSRTETVGSEERPLSVAVIRNARGSEYFTVEQTDEQYLRLFGGVELAMEDDTATHTIIAQELTINLDKKTLSASGLVEYTVERPEETETFRGDSVVFHIQNWDGLFLRGFTDTGRTIEEEALDFTIFGERITRSTGDIVVIDGGVITSSVADPPNYEIRARRIWLLAPGEWGIRNAVLHVGRVPMFYIPYFFFPGDRLFFNPAVGVRTREGAFIQTTTYLFGQSEEADPPFSIMQIAEVPSDQEREIRGLFLRIPDEPREVQRPEWSLKAMADVYTTLGYYGGAAGSQPDWGPFSRFDWRLGMGTSRNIYLENEVYTSYYIDDAGRARRRWNTGYFADRPFPFRFEAELDTTVPFDGGSWTLRYEMLSDPRFRRDYGNRSESIDWTRILNQTEDEELVASDINSLRWESQLRWAPDISALSPWITSLQLSTLRGDLRWSSRSNAEAPSPVTRPDSDNSPEERFFFPDTAVFPEIAVDVRGTLFDLRGDTDTREDDDDTEEGSGEIDSTPRPPWEPGPRPPGAVEERFRLPDPADDLPGIDTSRRSGGITIGYTLRPSLRTDRVADSSGWSAPNDIDFGWRYATTQNRNRGVLSARVVSPGGWVHYDGTLTGEHRYQSVDAISAMEDAERSSLERAAFAFRGETLTQSSTTTGYPLLDVPDLEGSTLRHELVSRVYERSFDRIEEPSGRPIYQERYGEWAPEGISTHSGTATIRWRVWNADQILTTKAVLPPLDRAYTGSVTAVTGPLTSTFATGIQETEEEGWVRDPLVQTHRFRMFDEKLGADQRLEYDLEESELLQSRSNFRAWPLRWELTGRRTSGVEFVPATGWVTRGDPEFRWTTMAFGLAGEPEFTMWKRRINLGLQGGLLYEADLQRFTSSSLLLDYGFSLDIYRFLTLTVAARSRNDLVYQYDRRMAREVDRPYRDPVEDLINSLRLFDREAREDSFFKIESVEVRGVHDLQDWELSFSWVGGPELVNQAGISRYEWQNIFTVLVRWRPISEIRRDIRIEDGILEFVES
jgi:hypothetical protein